MKSGLETCPPAESDGGGKGEHGGFREAKAVRERRQRPAHIPHLGTESGKLEREKIGVSGKLLERPFTLNLLHCAGELLGVQAVGIELNAHCAKIGHDLVELRRAGELRDGSEPFGGLLRRRADAGELWGSGTGGLPGGTKPGTGGFPGGPKLLKPLRGNPSGLRRPAEVRLDLLQGSVNDGKIAGRFLRAVRPYLNSYRRVVHGLPLVFLLRFSVSAAWADKKAVSMLRKVRIS